MEIRVLQLLEGARQARGLVVVVDVFRAFSTACYARELGAGALYPVDTIEEAFRMKGRFPGALLMGERDEKKPEGFDFGNSPFHLLHADIRGKEVIHTTSSGTQGIVHATDADQIITGSFVNAGAIVRYIRQCDPATVSLVCMGYACQYPTDEDTLCAEYIRNVLAGVPYDWKSMKERIRQGSGARFFVEASREWAPEEDFGLCLDRDRFNFVLKVAYEGDIRYLSRIDI
jgi:2-phosphosulfolactate phosphatase